MSAKPTPAVTVRMYDVGFGDCFLLRIPTPEGEKKILIDCGSFGSLPSKPGGGRGAKKQTIEEIAGAVIDDLAEDEPGGVPRADVVVVTHRHKDHISGFVHPRWATVKVG